METGIRILLLSLVLTLSGCASIGNWIHARQDAREAKKEAAEQAQADAQANSDDANQAPPKVIDPTVARRKVRVPRIDTENIEIGGVFGALSVEDFGTNPVYGVTAAYHVTEDFIFQAEAGRTTAG